MYHYKDSGLDNIYLVNGFEKHETAYGAGVAIDDIDGLHKAIGKWLATVPKLITGAELRFLRHELDLSQKKLGLMMGKSEQAIGRWERGSAKAIDPAADRLIRIFYVEHVEGNGSVRSLIEKLCLSDQLEHVRCQLEERNGRWRIAA